LVEEGLRGVLAPLRNLGFQKREVREKETIFTICTLDLKKYRRLCTVIKQAVDLYTGLAIYVTGT
jgi:hypothetical protein